MRHAEPVEIEFYYLYKEYRVKYTRRKLTVWDRTSNGWFTITDSQFRENYNVDSDWKFYEFKGKSAKSELHAVCLSLIREVCEGSGGCYRLREAPKSERIDTYRPTEVIALLSNTWGCLPNI